jgi:hypothetical protein
MEQTLNTQWSARMVKTDGQIVCLRSGSRAALDNTASPRCALAENSGDLALTLGVMGNDSMTLFPATPATRARALSARLAPAQPFSAR